MRIDVDESITHVILEMNVSQFGRNMCYVQPGLREARFISETTRMNAAWLAWRRIPPRGQKCWILGVRSVLFLMQNWQWLSNMSNPLVWVA